MGFPPDNNRFTPHSTHGPLKRLRPLHIWSDYLAFVGPSLGIHGVDETQGQIEIAEEYGRGLHARNGVQAPGRDWPVGARHLPKSISITPVAQRLPTVSASDFEVKTPRTTQPTFSEKALRLWLASSGIVDT